MRHEPVEGDGGAGCASAGTTSAEGNTEEGNGGRMGGVARRAAQRDGFAGPRGRRRGGMAARGYADGGAAGWLRGAARERAASRGRTRVCPDWLGLCPDRYGRVLGASGHTPTSRMSGR